LAAGRNGEIPMPRTRRWIALGLLLAAPLLYGQTAAPATQSTTRHRKSHKAPKPLVLPPLPSGPLPQVPMDQLPAMPAKVGYQGGLLTIAAQNSTLGEILRDVRKLTGASIDVPPGSGAERVVAYLGPGAPRDVLAALLNGTSLNYVMLGSSSDPTMVSSVILSPKPPATAGTQTAANPYQYNPGATPPNRYPQPQPFNQQVVVPQPANVQPANAEVDDSAKDEEQDSTENADENADDQGQPPAQPETNGGDVAGQPQPPDPNQPNAGPKTPEQILEMLRRQQPPGAVVSPQEPPQQ
jgi:hypothetical protein